MLPDRIELCKNARNFQIAEMKRLPIEGSKRGRAVRLLISGVLLLTAVAEVRGETVLCPGAPPIQVHERDGQGWKPLPLLSGRLRKVEIRSFRKDGETTWNVICFRGEGYVAFPFRTKACRFAPGTRTSKGQVTGFAMDLTICEMMSDDDSNATECVVACDD